LSGTGAFYRNRGEEGRKNGSGRYLKKKPKRRWRDSAPQPFPPPPLEVPAFG
jgi:hypothetical protein